METVTEPEVETIVANLEIPATIRNRNSFLASILVRSASKHAYNMSARKDNTQLEMQACWDAGRLLYALAEFLKECSF